MTDEIAATLADAITTYTCTRKCFGVAGYSASCCKLEERDFIQGPVGDVEATLARLSARFGREVPFDEVFVGFEEGSRLFPGRSRWQVPSAFPAIRPVMDSDRGFPCPFLGDDGLCTVYDERPEMCQRYRCDHLQSVLNVTL